MYTLAMSKEFSAKHFLIGGDWGDENRPHAHRYRLEIHLGGEALDEHGFLVDIVEFGKQLRALMRRYQDATLNEMSAFSDLNPSIENFCRILAREMDRMLPFDNLHSIRVRLREDDIAWASYHLQRS